MPLGLTIDNDPKTKENRINDQRGFVDNDIPLLESFKILKDGKPPANFYLSPDDYRSFIDWLVNGPANPLPSVPLRIMCYYRSQIVSGMDDVGTTDGMRLKQENLLKSIDEMIRGGNDDTDPILMCATGGSAAPAPPESSSCCNEIKPELEAIKQSLEEIKKNKPESPAHDNSAELTDIKTLIEENKAPDYIKNFDEIKSLLQGKSGSQDVTALLEEFAAKHGDDPELQAKIKGLIPSGAVNLDEIKELIKSKSVCDLTELSGKIDEIGAKVDTLTNIVTNTLATEVGESLATGKTLLERLGEARGNISRLLTSKPGKPDQALEIKAAQIAEKAAQASEEADRALNELNAIKSDNKSSAEDVEAAVEVATTARNKSDRLIAEAQQLWELVNPSSNNSSSSTAVPTVAPETVIVPDSAQQASAQESSVQQGPVQPDAIPDSAQQGPVKPQSIPDSAQQPSAQQPSAQQPSAQQQPQPSAPQVGGRGSSKNQEPITVAKEKVRALSESVSNAKRIIREKRAKTANANSDAKTELITSLRAKLADAEKELVDLRAKLAAGGDHLTTATELEEKVIKLTGLLKQITGDEPDLEKGIHNHLAANADNSVLLKTLQAQVAGLPDLETLKEKLAASILKIDELDGVSLGGQELEELKKEVDAAAAIHVADQKEKTRLQDEIDRITALLTPMKQNHVDVSRSCNDKITELAEAERTVVELKDRIAALETGDAGIAGLKRELLQKNADLLTATESLRTVTVEKAAIADELARNLEALTQLRTQEGSTGAELEALKISMNGKKDELTALINERDRLQGELAEKTGPDATALRRQLADKNIKISSLEADNDVSQESLLEKTKNLESVSSRLAALQISMNGKKDELAALVNDRDRLQAELAEKTGPDADALRRQLADKNIKISTLEADYDVSQESLLQKTKNLESVSLRLAVSEADAEEHTRLEGLATAELGALRLRLEGLESRRQELEAEKSAIAGKNSSAVAKIEEQLADSEKKQEQLKTALAAAGSQQAASAASIASSGETIRILRDELSQQKQKAESANNEVSVLRMKLQELSSGQVEQLSDLKRKLEEALSFARNMKAQRNQKESESASWHRAHVNEIAKNQALTKEVETIFAEQKKAQAPLQQRIKAAEQEAESLRTQLGSEKRSTDVSDVQLREAEATIQQLRLEIQQLKLALRTYSPETRHTLPNQYEPTQATKKVKDAPSNTATRKAVPSYMQNTASRKAYYNATQPQLDAKGRVSHGSTYSARPAWKGGKKGALFIKSQKKIRPLD